MFDRNLTTRECDLDQPYLTNLPTPTVLIYCIIYPQLSFNCMIVHYPHYFSRSIFIKKKSKFFRFFPFPF